MKSLGEARSSLDKGIPPVQRLAKLRESELGSELTWDVTQF